ncbi:hypothetical protein RclHR1_11860002 [Rhizophagus clarus]|uniref:Ion transport domain-containing protein n=1 Tax=Rhizophagus clarus TaxID=94130 RepID=A0A2Z6Q6X5_9GLOM|nr:hypothetical protein RclHR1_11860002 [Rhizophagus clarus]
MSNVTKEIEIDKNELYGQIQHKLHNGSINKIEVSSNGKYLVTYCESDRSIIGWNVEDINEGKLESDIIIKINYNLFEDNVKQICVSDDKKLAYICGKRLEIINIYNNKEIKLNLKSDARYCAFNSKGEFILYGIVHNRVSIWIFSTQTKNDEWICKRNYEIRNDSQLINISKDNKFYFAANNFIYEYNILTGKNIRIFCNYENNENNELVDKISSNESFTCLKTKDKIIIYSIELEIPVATLDINNDTQLYNFIKQTGSSNLLLPLLSNSEIWNSIMKHYWRKCLDRLEQNNELSNEYQTENLPDLPYNIQTTNEYAFGVISEYIWKFKLENTYETLEKLHDHFDKKETYKSYDQLSIHLFNSYMNIKYEDISAEKFEFKEENQEPIELFRNLVKWEVKINYKNVELQVYKKIDVDSEWELICKKRIDELNICYIPMLLNDNSIFILTTIGIFIYHFDENNKSIFLSYFYYMDLNKYYNNTKKLQYHYKKVFSNHTLPSPNYESFKLNDSWISYIIDNKENLLKYGDELLSFAIKEDKLELIDEIYKKCINYFEEDLVNNRMFLSIISHIIPLLNRYYPEYISRYLSETDLIVDSPFYNIKHQNDNLHLYAFQYDSQIINSTLWSKYQILYKIVYYILNTILQLTSFIKFPTYITKSTKPTIIFMNPYIKFVNYPQNYNWFLDFIKPKTSPFIETINENIYKTWNGEALINFKWNTYGKYYYMIIWIMFTALLGCFTAVSTIPQIYNNEGIQKQLLTASIILGFIHICFEIRQMVYNPIKWIYDFWNKIDMIAYLLPIYTSIYWLQINDRNDHIIRFAHAFYILSPLCVKTNVSIDFMTIISVLRFLTGDPNALSGYWAYLDSSIIILIVLYSFLIIIYLINVFADLLNMAINKDNVRVSYLTQKAKILADIELFCLLPTQRRWKSWFPEVIHYYADVDKTREKVIEMMSKGEWNTKEFSKLKEDLLIKLNINVNILPVD